jgi:DivIVA domain-containing protein
MTGDQIRQAQFREVRRGGYYTDDVDALVEVLAVAADRGEPLAGLANGAAFREARRGGYRPSDVDAFLDRVAASA